MKRLDDLSFTFPNALNKHYSQRYSQDAVDRRYVGQIESLILMGRLDRAKELIKRTDRLPKKLGSHLRHFSENSIESLFRTVVGSKMHNNDPHLRQSDSE